MKSINNMELYVVNKFGLFRLLPADEEVPLYHLPAICIVAAVPLRDDITHHIFEAADDESAKLIYEVGGYE